MIKSKRALAEWVLWWCHMTLFASFSVNSFFFLSLQCQLSFTFSKLSLLHCLSVPFFLTFSFLLLSFCTVTHPEVFFVVQTSDTHIHNKHMWVWSEKLPRFGGALSWLLNQQELSKGVHNLWITALLILMRALDHVFIALKHARLCFWTIVSSILYLLTLHAGTCLLSALITNSQKGWTYQELAKGSWSNGVAPGHKSQPVSVFLGFFFSRLFLLFCYPCRIIYLEQAGGFSVQQDQGETMTFKF